MKQVAIIVLFMAGLRLGVTAASSTGFNVIVSLIGKAATSEVVKGFIADHQMEMANTSRYFSKNGIEMKLKDGVVSEMHLYNNSPVYGTYTEGLPGELHFGMSSSEVKGILGKPKVAYTTTGYCEYEYPTHILSCWFEGDKLNQIVVSMKEE